MTDNVVLVCVDSLRQDFVEQDLSRTPYLDDLADSGIEYRNLFSTASTTTPAVASFLTGKLPRANGINSIHGELADGIESLPRILNENGWRTYAMVTGPLYEKTGLSKGFDYYWYRKYANGLVPGRDDDGTWKRAAKKKLNAIVSGSGDPFFLYLHLWELHMPISAPPTTADSVSGVNKYGRMLSALDAELEEFLSVLPDDTLLIVHGDHGESIYKRESKLREYLTSLRDTLRYTKGYDTRRVESLINRLSTLSDYEDEYVENGHDTKVSDYMTNVPLIISNCGYDETVDSTCRQVDIFPTILELLDVSHAVESDMESLVPPQSVDDRVCYSQASGVTLVDESNWSRSVRTPTHRLVEYPHKDWDDELYEVNCDGERNKRIVDEELTAELGDKLKESSLFSPDESNTSEIYAETAERLKELGYM